MSTPERQSTPEAGSPSYTLARQVLTATIEGAKRKRLLAAVAAFHDEGHAPSLRELTKRANLECPTFTLTLLRRLEADGLLRIEWSEPSDSTTRNRYEVVISALAPPE